MRQARLLFSTQIISSNDGHVMHGKWQYIENLLKMACRPPLKYLFIWPTVAISIGLRCRAYRADGRLA